jgi:hypothetical protein
MDATYARPIDRLRLAALRAAGYRGPAYLQGRPAYQYVGKPRAAARGDEALRAA